MAGAFSRCWRARLVPFSIPTAVPTARRSAWETTSRACRDRLLAFSAITWLVVSAGGCGGNPASSFRPPSGYQVVEIGAATVVLTDAEVALRRVLDGPATLEFKDTPLKAAAGHIAQVHGIRVVLDRSILQSIGPDAPITFSASGITLRAALKTMLEDVDAAYWIANESLILGTKDAAEDHMVQRVYYVRDLVEGAYAPGATPAQALLGWSSVQTAEGLKHGGFANADYDSLMDLIKEIIKPDSWDDVGGPGSMEPFPQRYCLVISQTNDTHERIEDLFRRLRTIPR